MISDIWKSYIYLQVNRYIHQTVNYQLNFVDPVTVATTNHVESMGQKDCQKYVGLTELCFIAIWEYICVENAMAMDIFLTYILIGI